MKTILSISGGGCRGVVPAVILSEVERRLGKKSAEVFDLISGTSTGSILALGLVKTDSEGKVQYSASDLVKLYEDYAKVIFERSTWHKIRSVGNLLNPKYPNKNLKKILETYFGDARLKDCYTDVFLTSYEIEERFPFFFKSKRAKQTDEYNFKYVDAALASSAAPTFFQPHRIEGFKFGFVDGALVANNPSRLALTEARQTWRDEHDFLVVSLGTGEMVMKFEYDKAKNWGLAQWAVPAFYMLMDASDDTVDWQLREELSDQRYFRFQGFLSKGNEAMDNGSYENMHQLKILAQMIISKNDKKIDELCELLAKKGE